MLTRAIALCLLRLLYSAYSGYYTLPTQGIEQCLLFKSWSSTRMISTYPASVAIWLIKGHAMYYHVYVIIHVKYPYLSVVREGHCVPIVDFCLSLYNMHVLNRDFDFGFGLY